MRSNRSFIIVIFALSTFVALRVITMKPSVGPTMSSTPGEKLPCLVRTDFSDDAAWKKICDDIRKMAPYYREGYEKWREVNEAFGQHYPKEPPASVDFV